MMFGFGTPGTCCTFPIDIVTEPFAAIALNDPKTIDPVELVRRLRLPPAERVVGDPKTPPTTCKDPLLVIEMLPFVAAIEPTCQAPPSAVMLMLVGELAVIVIKLGNIPFNVF